MISTQPTPVRALAGGVGLCGSSVPSRASHASERLEVMSSNGSRPSTSDSDASARGRHVDAREAKRLAHVQKLDKLSAMYGGSGSGGAGSCSQPSSRGTKSCSAGHERGAAIRGTSASVTQRLSRNGSSNSMAAVPTQGTEADRVPVPGGPPVAPHGNMLRIPPELRPDGGEFLGVPMGGPPGRYAASGMVSPLPFESSLAPDFLALFANTWTDDADQ